MITHVDLARVALVSVLAAGCAAAPERERFIYLESESYGCGAAPGLGCGLALAPILTSLDAFEEVAESSVSWDGRYIRIELRPGASGDRVAEAAGAVMEGEEHRVGAEEASGVQEWFNAERTVALSQFEAGVIAKDFARDIAANAGLDAEDRDRLEALLREELERAFLQAHAAGGGVHRLWEQLAQAGGDFEERLAFLDETQRAQVVSFLDQAFADCP